MENNNSTYANWSGNQPSESGSYDTGSGILGSLWRSKWITLLVLSVGLTLGYLYYSKITPIYESTSKILLVKKESSRKFGAHEEFTYEEQIETQKNILRSEKLILQAIEKEGLDKLKVFQNKNNLVKIILGNFGAMQAGSIRYPDPNTLVLRYTSEDPDEAAVILSAIVVSYSDYLSRLYKSSSVESILLLTKAKDDLKKDIEKKNKEYKKFLDESPLLWRSEGSEGLTVHEVYMKEIERARSIQIVKNSEITAKIESIEGLMEEGAHREALKLLISDWANANEVEKSIEQAKKIDIKGGGRLLDLLMQEKLMLETLGVNHPKIKAVQIQIKMIKEDLEEQKSKLVVNKGGASDLAAQPDIDILEVGVQALSHQLEVGKKTLEKLQVQFENEQAKSKKMSNYLVQDEHLKKEIAHSRLLYESTLKNLDEISLVNDPGGIKIEVLSKASTGEKVKPDFSVIMTISGVLSCIIGMGIGLLIDVSDKRFSGPDEILAVFGIPVLGHIPVIQPDKRSVAMIKKDSDVKYLDPSICTFYQPKGRLSEAFRTIRTALYFNNRDADLRVIQVTSPNPGDGKTTLSCNLAVSIANSGKKVLLIEADFRKPRVQSMFGMESKEGICSVITGDIELPDVIQQTVVDNLWVLPCGTRPSNPSELITSPRFEELVCVAKEKFDFVLIDTPPLLAVTDPSAVAPRVDGVLLAMGLSKQSRGNVTRALDVLNSVRANVVGIVVNRVDSGTRYGGYRNSKYDYGYEYSNYENSYYTDSENVKHPGEEQVAFSGSKIGSRKRKD